MRRAKSLAPAPAPRSAARWGEAPLLCSLCTPLKPWVGGALTAPHIPGFQGPAAAPPAPDPVERGSGPASGSDSAWPGSGPRPSPSPTLHSRAFSSRGQVSCASRRHHPSPDQCQKGSSSLTLGHSALQCYAIPSLVPSYRHLSPTSSRAA